MLSRMPSKMERLLRVSAFIFGALVVALIVLAVFGSDCRPPPDWPGSLSWAYCVYEELVRWQTGLGALIGLLGLAWAALYNADLTAKRDQNRREIGKRSVATGFFTELQMMRAGLSGSVQTLDQCIENQDEIGMETKPLFVLRETPYFDVSISKISDLDILTGTMILDAYEVHEIARRNLDHVYREAARGTPQLLRTPQIKMIRKYFVLAVEAIDRAGKEIRRDSEVDSLIKESWRLQEKEGS